MFPYQDIIQGIEQLIAQEIPFLLRLSEEQVSNRRNHQRLVRLQYAPRCGHSMPNTEMGMLVFPDYTQDNDLWLQLQDYQHEDWQTLVQLLLYYNRHICHLIRAIDTTKRANYWLDYTGNRVTLDDMVHGYLAHLLLHLQQIHELITEN